MCGRYFFDKGTAEAIGKLDRESGNLAGQLAYGDVLPSETAAVLTGRRLSLSAEIMRWGFPQSQGKGLVINARAERVLERRMFRESVLHRRCVIPARHFYEWDAVRNKVTFSREEADVLYMAGFYDRFRDGDRFVILTTEANASVEQVHDRMPLILEEKELESWVYDDHFLDFALHKRSPQLKKYQAYEQQSLFQFMEPDF